MADEIGIMVGSIRARMSLLRESSKGIKSRFNSNVNQPVLNRPNVRTSLAQKKIERGDLVQKIRLKRYPSIDVDLDRVYAGSIEGDLDDARDLLMEAGFRNGPFAYVEVTEEFGPDDGSYWLHIITETGKLPFVQNRFGVFRRIKDQIHVVNWLDEDRGMVHFGAHREKSAPLQPARHAVVNDADARRGIRDFRNKLEDDLDIELTQVDI